MTARKHCSISETSTVANCWYKSFQALVKRKERWSRFLSGGRRRHCCSASAALAKQLRVSSPTRGQPTNRPWVAHLYYTSPRSSRMDFAGSVLFVTPARNVVYTVDLLTLLAALLGGPFIYYMEGGWHWNVLIFTAFSICFLALRVNKVDTRDRHGRLRSVSRIREP